MLRFFAALEHALIGIEACHSAHYWGRELTKLGHTVHVLPTQYVKPFVVGGKNQTRWNNETGCVHIGDHRFYALG
ncbi:hypothetical protein [Xenorhabdus bovienii]|uniref:hypothetical protein n=1 Tax=Xenorhabdus bovienii TaxID=40576 RepID=UPI0023B3397F|nr:hypothetical protein [Xenorhabdus bovienii]MDE9538265.1 hypothetical protein [Xenorhabdus bovienii]